ncbi:BZ3500_MvSof-1268-A1-R1_Chr8-1g09924 [Microbotryum saponariae]|uniref:BZ3500_MvSof-1268-A1-R1_Chr8-1g09924 protein n=1 Tax=Microbotryum saponariae TaxID=289078 RepID=A0A2X0LRK5_9BASI|nr:BZ3500_MvSof-1268-A1-R1_Chr8-1g09924 [Microbotryum saponariae]SDA08210.1 BZ3501_MvSof-1269-A2-R1_Chr8-1g09647 [Microbotryum saponariae]
MSSTSFITGTGLKKWKPTVCAARDPAAAAILVREIDEVLEARIACVGVVCASSAKIFSLRDRFSDTAWG